MNGCVCARAGMQTICIHLMKFLSRRFPWYSVNFLLYRPRYLHVTNLSGLSNIGSCITISGAGILTITLANTKAYHCNYNSYLKYPMEKIHIRNSLLHY